MKQTILLVFLSIYMMLGTANAQTYYGYGFDMQCANAHGESDGVFLNSKKEFVLAQTFTYNTANEKAFILHVRDSTALQNTGSIANPQYVTTHYPMTDTLVKLYFTNAPYLGAIYKVLRADSNLVIVYDGPLAGHNSFIPLHVPPTDYTSGQASAASGFPLVSGNVTHCLIWNNLIIASGVFDTLQTNTGAVLSHNVFACTKTGVLMPLGQGLPSQVLYTFIIPHTNTLCALTNSMHGYYEYNQGFNTWFYQSIYPTASFDTTYGAKMLYPRYTKNLTDSTVLMIGGYRYQSGALWDYSGSWVLNTNTHTIVLNKGATAGGTSYDGISAVVPFTDSSVLIGGRLTQIKDYAYGPNTYWSGGTSSLVFDFKHQTYTNLGVGGQSPSMDYYGSAVLNADAGTFAIMDTIDYTIKAPSTTGITTLVNQSSTMRILGNPVTDKLIVKTDGEYPSTVYDILGHYVLSIAPGKVTTTQVATLPNGLYIIRNNDAYAKFVKE